MLYESVEPSPQMPCMDGRSGKTHVYKIARNHTQRQHSSHYTTVRALTHVHTLTSYKQHKNVQLQSSLPSLASDFFQTQPPSCSAH